MKRILPVLALLLLFVLLMAACAGGAEKKPLPAAEDLAKTLLDAGIFADEMEAVDPEIAALLYGFSGEDGVDLYCWLSASGGTADEFTLFICRDGDALTAARKSAEARLENQKRTYESYAPDEVPKLEGAVVRVRDNTLVLCAAADPKKAAELLSPYFPA